MLATILVFTFSTGLAFGIISDNDQQIYPPTRFIDTFFLKKVGHLVRQAALIQVTRRLSQIRVFQNQSRGEKRRA
jgi:hypothetical protein